MKFKFLDHTAEVKFRAFGNSLEEAFSNVVYATFSLMSDVKKIKPLKKERIKVESSSKESLLFDFIDQLLFLLDTKGFFPCKVNKISITKNNNYVLNSDILGDDASKYETHGNVKAITYSDMFIKEEKRKVVIQVVLDV